MLTTKNLIKWEEHKLLTEKLKDEALAYHAYPLYRAYLKWQRFSNSISLKQKANEK